MPTTESAGSLALAAPEHTTDRSGPAGPVVARAAVIVEEHQLKVRASTDQLFAWLMGLQWLGGIVAALVISPKTWQGLTSTTHPHVYAAILMGGLLAVPSALLAYFRAGDRFTRYAIAASQMMFSSLLIHLSGGRIETHFHIFGSLALLAFYRDFAVLAIATFITAADHIVRGWFWPESIYGVSSGASWRWVEHAGWVLFADVFLVLFIRQSLVEIWAAATREAEVLENNSALADARIKAEAGARAKSEFLANMSHEIRTPLNGVIGVVDLLASTQLSSTQVRYTSLIKTSGHALLAIINDILDFSKIEAGKIELEAIPFDLQEVLDDVADIFGPKASERGLELMASVAPGTPTHLIGDATRLRQVLLNFTSNAIKFTEKGEVFIRARAEAFDAVKGLQTIVLAVRDTGPGIPADRLDRLFKVFSQVDASTTRKHGGTGLGLAICKQLVELMGGKVGVTSAVGRGSEFSFSIRVPLAKTPEQDTKSQAAELVGKRVLIVDDNTTNRLIIHEWAEAWQMRATEVSSAAEALAELDRRAATADPYTLIITDLNMPEMDGFGLTRSVRESKQLSALPVVLLSSSDTDDADVARRELRFAACLSKPVRRTDLRRALCRALGRSATGGTQDIRPADHSAGDSTPVRSGLLAKLLVVEDNEVNQVVVSEMLRAAGHQPVIASSGAEALAAIKREPFDMVFMDCMMPGMDGFESTGHVRKLEQSGRSATPDRLTIVALTANAMEGDRERCLEAGMDDYLTKPIDSEKLLATIDRILSASRKARRPLHWQPHADQSPSSPNCPTAPSNDGGGQASLPSAPVAPPAAPSPSDALAPRATPGTPIIDVPALLKRCMNNPKVALSVLDTLDRILPERLTAMQAACAAADLEQIRAIAHGIKGSCANASVEQVRAVAAQMEQLAREHQTAEASGLLESLGETLRQARQEIPKVRQAIQAMPGGPAKPTATGPRPGTP